MLGAHNKYDGDDGNLSLTVLNQLPNWRLNSTVYTNLILTIDIDDHHFDGCTLYTLIMMTGIVETLKANQNTK